MYKILRNVSRGLDIFKKGQEVADEVGSTLPSEYAVKVVDVEVSDSETTGDEKLNKTRKTKEVSDSETK